MSPNAPIFCLASGRSGTHFLYEILRRNTVGTICRHEPYLRNPSMFGRAIYAHSKADESALRRVALRKKCIIEGHLRSGTYIETSHALLKSWFQLAIEFFPGMKLIHLVRNPLAVAKSEEARETIAHRWRLPYRNYRGEDGRAYFRWSLTGLEPIYRHFSPGSLNRLQWYVLQWIEIENRAMRFLAEHGKQRDTFTLHSPIELNQREKLEELFEFLKLRRRSNSLSLAGRRNRTPGAIVEICDADQRDFHSVVSCVPPEYLTIFAQPPYTNWAWSEALSRFAAVR